VVLRPLSQFLLDERILRRDDRVVMGVSGGADSTALLYILSDLNRELDWGLALHAAHLDHGLRGGESDADATFVHAAADALSIPCTVERRDVAALSAAEGVGIEEIARRERYAFFERVCLQVGAKIVAVGHHADDNAETILHRILRGTGLRGLSGIPRVRALAPRSDIKLIRPLLHLTRAELRRYLVDSGVAFREDSSNMSTEPMRNRLRHSILPRIESEVNPQAREALLRLGSQAVWLEEFLHETVDRTFDTLVISRTDQELVLNAEALARKSRIFQTELVRRAYTSFGLGEQDLGFTHLVAAMELIEDQTSGRQTILPGGMTVEKRYGQLILSLPSDEPREEIAEAIAVHLPGKTVLPMRGLELECTEEEVDPATIPSLRASADRGNQVVDRSAVHPPILIRTRRPGDRFTPLGAPGSKKISDFLADLHVDPRDRQRVALLCDQLGPFWVVGYRIDDRVKLTGLTHRVLRLRARTWDR
jgi:tRNA(Ile)-lysidine synthase